MFYFSLSLYLLILVSIAFTTLLERKFLGYLHLRKGPNKINLIGLTQPFSDALKLLTKSYFTPQKANPILYTNSYIISLILMFFMWLTIPMKNINFFNLNLLVIVLISSLSIYPLLTSGWSSNSKYALLGAYRGVAQVISYEVSFSLLLLTLIFLPKSFNLTNLTNMNTLFSTLLHLNFLFPFWFLIITAEVNRNPYDFSESESELVSGFNIEFGSGLFTLLFLSEYGNILFFSYLSFVLFSKNFFIFFITLILFLSTRGSLPRDRYDFLMTLAWKTILSFTLLSFMFITWMNFF